MPEFLAVPGRRLGRRDPKGAPALHFASFWTGAVPAHPAADDHLAKVSAWELGGNDQFGTCGPTSVANARRQLVAYLAPQGPIPTLDDVFDLYRRSGNPDFDPATGADDNGVDMQTMLEALLKGGIGGAKPVAFAKVDHANVDELRAAIAIFGGALLGVVLEVAQQGQTDRGLWDYVRSATWGGHAVLAGRYTSAARGPDVGLVSWDMVLAMTDAFAAHQLEEVWVVVWPEHLGTAQFDEGVNKAALALAYKDLTGRDFPAAPPAPAPGPAPADALQELASLIRQWIDGAEQQAAAFRDWLERHGL